jgi:hypothetical protein
MSYRKTIAAIVFAAVAGLLPGAVEAQTVEGTYRLTEIDSAPLPTVVDVDDEGRCREELVSATLTLHTGGRWNLVSRDRKVCYGDLVEDVDEEFDEGHFLVDGSTITFLDEQGHLPRVDYDLDRDIEIDDLGTGTLGRNGLSVRLEDGPVAIFRR